MIHTNSERLRSYIDAFTSKEVGGTSGGGVSRLAATDADKAARDKFTSISYDLGLKVSVDDVGNMYAHRQGTDPDALPVVIGSHLDTVVPGGKYDGILGIAIALETIALLQEHNISTKRPLVVVNWTGEEGARFAPAMIGSGVATGVFDIDYAHSRTDPQGLTLGDELERIGYLGKRENRLGNFFSALEVHIEQGVKLEQQGNDVGVVSHIQPVQWSTVKVQGPGGHAGGQRVSERQESIVAAARMILAVRNSARQEDAFRATVGKIELVPGSNNVIPSEVEFSLDLRSRDNEQLDYYLGEMTKCFRTIAAEENVTFSIDNYWRLKGASFDSHLVELLQTVANQKEIRWLDIEGSIGHDSLHLARKGPTAMLFTRTVKGLSHCEEEDVPWESALATSDVFAAATLALAQADSLDTLAHSGSLDQSITHIGSE